MGEGSYITFSLKFQLGGSKMPDFSPYIWEDFLKNKKFLHLGVEKGLIFFNGWKDI